MGSGTRFHNGQALYNIDGDFVASQISVSLVTSVYQNVFSNTGGYDFLTGRLINNTDKGGFFTPDAGTTEFFVGQYSDLTIAFSKLGGKLGSSQAIQFKSQSDPTDTAGDTVRVELVKFSRNTIY